MPVRVPTVSLVETIQEAFENLYRQGIRSTLALLGILIGTASIVAMLTIGQMAQRETMKMFSAMGVNVLQLRATTLDGSPTHLDRGPLERLPAVVPGVAMVAPMAVGRSDGFANRQKLSVALIGVTPTFFDLTGLRAATGRLIEQVESESLVAVLGAQAASGLSTPGRRIIPGSRITVGGYGLTVIGILDPVRNTGLDPDDYNGAVFVPLPASRRFLPDKGPAVAMVRMQPLADVDRVSAAVAATLSTKQTIVQIQKARDVVAMVNAQKAVHSRLLAAIGAISLLVGGIGVMNVMLMGIMERRREIGLRSAIGATPGDVQRMFLVEAAMLAFAGGVAGALLGVVAAWIFARVSTWTFAVEPYVLVLGPGIAAAVGLIFGSYPAVTASRLKPVDALRAD